MRRALLVLGLALLGGCQRYSRDMAMCQPVEHRFTRVEFVQFGCARVPLVWPFKSQEWDDQSSVVLISDDGWKMVIEPQDSRWAVSNLLEVGVPQTTQPGRSRVVLIDPQGKMHPVRTTVGPLSPPLPSGVAYVPLTTQKE